MTDDDLCLSHFSDELITKEMAERLQMEKRKVQWKFINDDTVHFRAMVDYLLLYTYLFLLGKSDY